VWHGRVVAREAQHQNVQSLAHLALCTDAETSRIVAATLTGSDASDAAHLGPLLDQVPGPVASFMVDGA
jgi:hypothetical protein